MERPAPFLKQVCEYLLKRNGEDLHHCILVFPNRRAGLYLKKHLAALIDKPVWAPAVYSIEDFVLSLAGTAQADQHQLLLLLYRAYRELEKDKARDFEDFLNWAPVMLDDFNEIDLYLADPEKVFTYLLQAREISQWTPDQTEPTDFQKNYLHFYASLKDYYAVFHRLMQEHRLLSQGAAYRYVAGNMETLSARLRGKQLLFAGFNALTKAEAQIITYLMHRADADILWDADSYYLDNEDQEAGDFLRKYRNKPEFSSFRWISQDFRDIPKRIRVTGIPQHIGQAKMAGQLLAGIPPEEWSETALILGDENMLVPVLNSIPESIKDFNVTMGFPLRLAPLNALFESLIQIYLHAAVFFRDGKDPASQAVFHVRDLLGFFRHPMISALLDANHRNAGLNDPDHENGLKAREEVLLTRTYFSLNDLLREVVQPALTDPYPFQPLFGLYFDRPGEILGACQQATAYLKDFWLQHSGEQENKGSLELEYCYSFSLLFSQIRQTWEGSGIDLTFRSLFKLYRQSVRTVKLPFYGEPLAGLQVMGMLETRNLDFRNIIMLHVNDDVIPSGKSYTSFIPSDIKKHYGLPTYRERQAVFAYHFYRLLQRSEKVHLLYNTEPGQVGGGDKSRFIYQLMHELPSANPLTTISGDIISFPAPGIHAIKPIIIGKTAEIDRRIEGINASGWSATGLNTLRLCPLRFYFSHILGLQEIRETDETMDAASFGSAFHELLEKLMKPLIGKDLHPEDIDRVIPGIPEIAAEAFSNHALHGDLSYGKNLLLLKVAETLVRRYLRKERANLEELARKKQSARILFLEKRMEASLGPYRLKGIADRIDRWGDQVRILDYKTGSVKPEDMKLRDEEQLQQSPAADKIFQLLFYSFLYWQTGSPRPASVSPGILSLRTPEADPFQPQLPGNAGVIPDGLSMIENLVMRLLDDLFSPGFCFVQTEDLAYCSRCPYKTICIR